jgi:hypothetical protein
VTPLGAILLIVFILAVLGALLGAVVVVAGRRSRRIAAGLATELEDENAVLGPETAVYRGGSGPYPRLKGKGLIVLTPRRLMFRILVGRDVDIRCAEITGVREAKRFRGAFVGGQMHLVVATADGEVAFFVADNAAWMAALARTAHVPSG